VSTTTGVWESATTEAQAGASVAAEACAILPMLRWGRTHGEENKERKGKKKRAF